MIDRYLLKVFSSFDDAELFEGYFRSFNKVIRFASCFSLRDVNIEITDNFKNVQLDDDLVYSCINEIKKGFRVYEVCD